MWYVEMLAVDGMQAKSSYCVALTDYQEIVHAQVSVMQQEMFDKQEKEF